MTAIILSWIISNPTATCISDPMVWRSEFNDERVWTRTIGHTASRYMYLHLYKTHMRCHAMQLDEWRDGPLPMNPRNPATLIHTTCTLYSGVCICIPRWIEYSEPYLEFVWVSSSDLVLPPSSFHPAGDAMVWFRWKVSRDALLRVCGRSLTAGSECDVSWLFVRVDHGQCEESWQVRLHSWDGYHHPVHAP